MHLTADRSFGGGHDEQLELAVAGHQDSMRWLLHLEIRLLEVADWFADVGGIELRVLKGPAVAHLDEVDPALRSFSDLDLLIAAADMDRGIAALQRGVRCGGPRSGVPALIAASPGGWR